jgi:V8-like Glu-specific endopeptidase
MIGEKPFPVGKEDLKYVLHRSIVAITFLNKQKSMLTGSGVLISPNLVLTAAQNIYDKR